VILNALYALYSSTIPTPDMPERLAPADDDARFAAPAPAAPNEVAFRSAAAGLVDVAGSRLEVAARAKRRGAASAGNWSRERQAIGALNEPSEASNAVASRHIDFAQEILQVEARPKRDAPSWYSRQNFTAPSLGRFGSARR
jgi:hypothetical protein